MPERLPGPDRSGRAVPGLTFIDVAGVASGAGPEGAAPSLVLADKPRPVVAMGVFDGVHLGHRSLLERAFAEARGRRAPLWVLTFWPHPDTVVGPRSTAGYLVTTLEDKVSLLRGMGAERVVGLRFTRQAADVPPEEFFHKTLLARLAPQVLVVGFNFSFGRGGRGDPVLLGKLARPAGVEVIVHPAVRVAGETVSSSAVRRALAAGDVEQAGLLLGRPHSLAGPVERGAGRGRTLGFPTANVDYPADAAVPAPGVYVVSVRRGLNPIPTLSKAEPGVANIGTRPTFNPQPRPAGARGRVGGDSARGEVDRGGVRLETHLLAADSPPAYGDLVRVFFLKRLRREKRFSGPGELVRQIQKDRLRALEFFGIEMEGDSPPTR